MFDATLSSKQEPDHIIGLGWVGLGWVGSSAILVGQTFPYGRWYPPYSWGVPQPASPTGVLNLIHVGLIPTGPQQGRVVFVTWDSPTGPSAVNWGILDPDAQQPGLAPPMSAFVHVAPTSLPGWGEATCVGQSWTPDGRWFLAGGQSGPDFGSHRTTASATQNFGSSRAWIYDPDVVGSGGPATGAWFAEDPMAVRRYYPTVILSQVDAGLAPFGEMIVAGGSEDWFNGPFQPPTLSHDNYEVFRPGPRAWPNYLGGMRERTLLFAEVPMPLASSSIAA